MSITAAQLRAGRALINLTQDDLARAARLATKTIATFESEGRAHRELTLVSLQSALEKAGVVFVGTDVGVGVILSKAERP